MRFFLKLFDEAGRTGLLAAVAAGLYVAVFFTLNNLTMLRGGGILFLVCVLIAPLSVASMLVYYPLRRAGRGAWARIAVAFLISAFLLFSLRTPLLAIPAAAALLHAFPPGRTLLANTLLIAVPAALLTVFLHKRLKQYAAALGILVIAAVLIDAGRRTDWISTETEKKLPPGLQQIVLEEKPNIYFILADAYASLAYMKDRRIDITELTEFLSDSDFRLYDDTYSNYQPTTSAMPAFLDMEHHYYRLTGHGVDFTEVDKASRRIIGGENNVSNILRMNGYFIQYIHNGSYLFLQGCSADSCFPEVDGLAGARIVLSHILRMDLLSDDDKAWKTTTIEGMRAEISKLMRDERETPRFQYIHAFTPGHSPNARAGKCNEARQAEKYAVRVASAGNVLRQLIREITEQDPTAVIVLAGDHGPFITKKCARNAYIDDVADYRDRASAIMAVRWPRSYGGEYDDRIASGVNLLRYVLASLAKDPTPLLETVAADDVFVRARGKIWIVVEDGKALARPKRLSARRRRP